jgi:acyl carrier protein
VLTDTASAGTSATAPAPAGPAGSPEPAEAADTVLDLLRGQIARFMGLASDAIDPDRPARDLDVDSMAFVELKNAVEDQLGVALPLTALLDGASLREIAATVAGRLGYDKHRPAAPAGPAIPADRSADTAATLLTRVDEMTEAELDDLLARLPGATR